MIISYLDQGKTPARPAYCRCNFQQGHYQKRGAYFRRVAQVWAYFFQCVRCQTHITMLPSTCVPYKHHPASEIEHCLDQSMSSERSPHVVDREDRRGVHRSTMYRWLSEWRVNSTQIASLANEKLSCLISGGFKRIYQALRRRYSSGDILAAVQSELCRDYPPMGVLRPLISLS